MSSSAKYRNIYCITVCLGVSMVQPSFAAEPNYWSDIRPLMRRNCTVCHSVRTVKERDVSGGLALDTYDAIAKTAIVPGNPDASELFKRLISKNPAKRMPLDTDALTDEEIAIVRRWIAGGAIEGVRPKESAAAASNGVAHRHARIDVVIPTKLAPPRSLTSPPLPYNKFAELVLPIGPLSPVTALAFSPDGQLIAVGAYGCATIWGLRDVRPIRVLTNVLGAINDLKFSPDGRMLAVAGGQPSARGDVRLYDSAGWQLIATLGGHADVVSSVAFSPDGTKLASASFDKSVRVWDIAKRQVGFTFTGHSDFVYAVTWDPKGEWIASASKDRTIKVFDAKSCQTRLTMSGMEQDVLALAITADGSQIISSGFESQMHWWNAKTGERIRKITGHDIAVHEICSGRDGKLVASAGADKTLRLWNVSTGQSARVISVGSMLYAVALNPASSRVAAGSFDGLVRVYEPSSGKLIATLVSVGDEWLAQTPQGYFSASDGWAGACRWRVAAQELPAAVLQKVLRNPEAVAQLFAGAKVSDPAFPR